MASSKRGQFAFAFSSLRPIAGREGKKRRNEGGGVDSQMMVVVAMG
jgi:hypothetical protein